MYILIVLLVLGIFAVDLIYRWWRENEWKRRWSDHSRDD